jgi:hypothetical protein
MTKIEIEKVKNEIKIRLEYLLFERMFDRFFLSTNFYISFSLLFFQEYWFSVIFVLIATTYYVFNQSLDAGKVIGLNKNIKIDDRKIKNFRYRVPESDWSDEEIMNLYKE